MNPELKQKLEDLNRYLSESEDIDESVRGKLVASLGGIESALASEDEEETHHGPLDALKGAVADLEAQHPHAADMMRELTHILSRMGI